MMVLEVHTVGAAAVAVVATATIWWSLPVLGRFAILGGTVMALLAGNVALVAFAWLGASIVAAHSGAGGKVQAAYGTAGDAIAVVALVAFAVDGGTTAVPWHDSGSPIPAWFPVLFATGVAVRWLATGPPSVAPLLVTPACLAAFLAASLGPADRSLVLIAPVIVGVVVAWRGAHVTGVVLVGLGSWVVSDASVSAVSGVLLVSGALVTLVPAAREVVWPVGKRLTWRDVVAPVPVDAGTWTGSWGVGVLLIPPLVVASALLLAGPDPGTTEVAPVLVTVGVLAWLAALRAGSGIRAAPAAWVSTGEERANPGRSARRQRPGMGGVVLTVLAGAAVVSVLFVPASFVEIAGLPVPPSEVVEASRRGLSHAVVFAVAVTGLVALSSRRAGSRVRGSSRPRA